MALFGVTARQWREANPKLKEIMSDYATINQIAIKQMKVLEEGMENRKLLK
jgi:hypothetical protein